MNPGYFHGIILTVVLALGVVPTAAGTDDALPFEPRLGACTSLKNVELMEASGCDYLEAGVRWFLVPDKPDEEFAANLAAARKCKLPIQAANGFLPAALKCVGPKADHAAVLEFARVAFERAQAVGMKKIVFGSSGARAIPEGFDRARAEQQFICLLMKMGPLAAANDVTIVIEPLNTKECNFINTVLEGARIVDAVNHPNIRLLADIYHMTRMNEPPENILKVGHLLRHVHIAENDKRTPPGVMGDDFRPYLQALADVGYRGGISCECRWKEMSAELPVAVKTLREQISGLRLGSSALTAFPNIVPLTFTANSPQWTQEDGSPPRWKRLKTGLQVVPGSGSIITKEKYQDFRLHVEFNVPKLPPLETGVDRGNRGNSGVYLQRRYEIQILDSHGMGPEIWDCGAIYRFKKPDKNASKPAGQWQSYDIVFCAPRWESDGADARKIENARITVFHNGVLIHDDVEVKSKTGQGQPEGPKPDRILLQDHGNEVSFRNIWIVPL